MFAGASIGLLLIFIGVVFLVTLFREPVGLSRQLLRLILHFGYPAEDGAATGLHKAVRVIAVVLAMDVGALFLYENLR